MSYILDALKKSDQERQQGNSPGLYSVHSSAPPVQKSSPFQLHRGWLFAGGMLIFLTCLGMFFFLNRQRTTQPTQSLPATLQTIESKTLPESAQQITEEKPPTPRVVIKENSNIRQSVAVENLSAPPTLPETEAPPKSLPMLQDLSASMQAQIPDLKFAGHTYSEDPAQRMIIVNGQILRQGDMIAPSIRLFEITWEGVVIDFKDTRFLIKTN